MEDQAKDWGSYCWYRTQLREERGRWQRRRQPEGSRRRRGRGQTRCCTYLFLRLVGPGGIDWFLSHGTVHSEVHIALPQGIKQFSFNRGIGKIGFNESVQSPWKNV